MVFPRQCNNLSYLAHIGRHSPAPVTWLLEDYYRVHCMFFVIVGSINKYVGHIQCPTEYLDCTSQWRRLSSSAISIPTYGAYILFFIILFHNWAYGSIIHSYIVVVTEESTRIQVSCTKDQWLFNAVLYNRKVVTGSFCRYNRVSNLGWNAGRLHLSLLVFIT